MSVINRNQAPYYDDYNPNKNYSQMLAIPGRVEQARDFTQVQTMIYDYLQRLSDTLLKDGSIVSGMGYILKESSIIVEDGRVYINGKIHNFKQQEVSITKTGEEIVGVKLVESIVTEAQDSSLLDPTTTTGNFGQPGTHRIKAEIVLTVNDPDASALYEFVDGGLQSEAPKPNFDGLQDMLAKRTFDESGNYRVRGLEIVVEQHDANNVRAVIEAGTAYVKGYQVIKPTPVKQILPMARDYKSVIGEPKVYKSGTTTYTLNNVPAKSISKLTGYVQVSQVVTRGGTPGGIDYLQHSPVVQIRSITAGGTTYKDGTDFQLSADGVDWGLGGAEPTSGSSYTVVYWFNKTFVQGVDYEMEQEIGEYGETKDSIQFLNGDKPATDTTIYVDYDFYLARIDALSIDKDGKIVVTTGQSDIPRNVKPPVVGNPDVLTLGNVYLPPNSGMGRAVFNPITRLEMADLQRLSKRIDDLEFNQAITALDREAMEGEVATDLRGIFSDSFRSMTRGNVTHPSFNIMYDLEMGTIMLPVSSTKTHKPTITNANNVKNWGRVVTAPMLEKLAFRQQYATTTMLVNPYLSFNSMGILSLNPAVDNWIETESMEIEKLEFQAKNLYRWWRHPDDAWRRDEAAWINDFTVEGGTNNGQSGANWRPGYHETGTLVKTEKSRSIIDEAITYMRRISVKVTASNLQPGTDNLECYFDGVRVALSPASGYSAGSLSGSLRANSSGKVEGTFTIPENVRTGTREVVLRNASNTATGAFTSIGTKRTTVDTVLTTRVTVTGVDPLAQTFQFDTETILTSVGVYFAAKSSNHNIICQIRNVVNGYPGQVILGEKVITPGEIKVSENASQETRVTFDSPVVCSPNEQYAMTFLTDSDVHSMYVADLGQKDVTTGIKVNSQPYLAGMLFSSSNGLAWTPHQSMNMKFNIYKAQFNSTTTINFSELTNAGADRVLLLADALVPAGTSCTWQVSLDAGSTWQSITPYSDLNLLNVSSRVRVRALITTNGSMSPIIAVDGINLVTFTSNLSGSYIGRNVELADTFTTVTQVFDAHIPSGCTVTPQFSYNKGSSWVTPTLSSSESMSSEFTRYTYKATVSGSQNAQNYMCRLNIVSNNQTLRPRARRFVNIIK
jgi:hypothetical protein